MRLFRRFSTLSLARLEPVALAALALGVTAVPAFATPISAPEPASMTLLGVAVGGIALVRKFRNRK